MGYPTVTRNLAIANGSCVSCAHKATRVNVQRFLISHLKRMNEYRLSTPHLLTFTRIMKNSTYIVFKWQNLYFWSDFYTPLSGIFAPYPAGLLLDFVLLSVAAAVPCENIKYLKQQNSEITFKGRSCHESIERK